MYSQVILSHSCTFSKTSQFKLLIFKTVPNFVLSQFFDRNVIPIERQACTIPQTLQGEWFSREDGENVYTVVESGGLSLQGQYRECLDLTNTHNDNFTLVLRQG